MLNDTWLVRCCLNLWSFWVDVYPYNWNNLCAIPDTLTLLVLDDFLVLIKKKMFFILLCCLCFFSSASVLRKILINSRNNVVFWISECNFFQVVYFPYRKIDLHYKLNMLLVLFLLASCSNILLPDLTGSGIHF